MLTKVVLLAQIACLGAVTIPKKFFNCVSGKCEQGGTSASGTELDECFILCEKRLWPYPSTLTMSETGRSLDGNVVWDITNIPTAVRGLMISMEQEFTAIAFTKGKSITGVPLKISLKVSSSNPTLGLSTNESYAIVGGDSGYEVTADTIFGARHGLTTISQLITYSKTNKVYRSPTKVTITDSPKYPYRGLMIDVSRNFISMETLKMNIRAMGMSKLNSLHLHISDTASFPIEVTGRLNVTETGAYSDSEVYRIKDLEILSNYSTVWGVRLIPEIDQPAHARAGWEWGPEAGLGDLVVCNAPDLQWNSSLEPPSGQLNPVNENVHKILKDIYKTLVTSLNPTIFHMGGDEVIVGSETSQKSCWNNSEKAKSVVDWLSTNGYDRSDAETWYGVWRNFTEKSLKNMEQVYSSQNANLDKIMQWAGTATGTWNLVTQPGRNVTFPVDKFMFQICDSYTNSLAPTLINEGYSVVISNYDLLYLDCGGSAWIEQDKSWCKYNSWYTIYDSVPTTLGVWGKKVNPDSMINLKGFEATMWTEHYDSISVMTALWPRAAALAERLWSDPSGTWQQADPRMQYHRSRLVEKGIITAALQPEWCLQNGAYSCTV